MAELVASAKMLIRRPASEVFNAFVQPELITKFWLNGSTGPLSPGAQVEWQFMVPGATERVQVTAFDEPSRIGFTWLNGGLDVEMRFAGQQPDITVVSVDVRGFKSEGENDSEGGTESGTEQVVNATEGFSIVLCDLKVLLESGRSAGLVKDKAELIQSARDA